MTDSLRTLAERALELHQIAFPTEGVWYHPARENFDEFSRTALPQLAQAYLHLADQDQLRNEVAEQCIDLQSRLSEAEGKLAELQTAMADKDETYARASHAYKMLAKAREALEWYANYRTYELREREGTAYQADIEADMGQKARQALSAQLSCSLEQENARIEGSNALRAQLVLAREWLEADTRVPYASSPDWQDEYANQAREAREKFRKAITNEY